MINIFNNDYIMRQIEEMTRAIARVVFNKETDNGEIFDEYGIISEENFMFYMLNNMLSEKRINEAENIIFELIEENKSKENLKIALWFYNKLQKLSDEELYENNFSREEIAEGLGSIKKIYNLN